MKVQIAPGQSFAPCLLGRDVCYQQQRLPCEPASSAGSSLSAEQLCSFSFWGCVGSPER